MQRFARPGRKSFGYAARNKGVPFPLVSRSSVLCTAEGCASSRRSLRQQPYGLLACGATEGYSLGSPGQRVRVRCSLPSTDHRGGLPAPFTPCRRGNILAEFPALPLWTDRFLAGTAHLSDSSLGLYTRLLLLMWSSPQCRIPNEDSWIAHKLNRPPEQFRPIIQEFCKTDGNWITQKRLLKEWRWVREKVKKNRDAAKSRWNKEKILSERNADAMPLYPHTHLNQDRKIVDISIGKRVVGGRVEMTDENKLSIFHNWLAPLLGAGGWEIIRVAMDSSSPDFAIAVETCRKTARKHGKGWPHQWPK